MSLCPGALVLNPLHGGMGVLHLNRAPTSVSCPTTHLPPTLKLLGFRVHLSPSRGGNLMACRGGNPFDLETQKPATAVGSVGRARPAPGFRSRRKALQSRAELGWAGATLKLQRRLLQPGDKLHCAEVGKTDCSSNCCCFIHFIYYLIRVVSYFCHCHHTAECYANVIYVMLTETS